MRVQRNYLWNSFGIVDKDAPSDDFDKLWGDVKDHKKNIIRSLWDAQINGVEEVSILDHNKFLIEKLMTYQRVSKYSNPNLSSISPIHL